MPYYKKITLPFAVYEDGTNVSWSLVFFVQASIGSDVELPSVARIIDMSEFVMKFDDESFDYTIPNITVDIFDPLHSVTYTSVFDFVNNPATYGDWSQTKAYFYKDATLKFKTTVQRSNYTYKNSILKLSLETEIITDINTAIVRTASYIDDEGNTVEEEPQNPLALTPPTYENQFTHRPHIYTILTKILQLMCGKTSFNYGWDIVSGNFNIGGKRKSGGSGTPPSGVYDLTTLYSNNAWWRFLCGEKEESPETDYLYDSFSTVKDWLMEFQKKYCLYIGIDESWNAFIRPICNLGSFSSIPVGDVLDITMRGGKVYDGTYCKINADPGEVISLLPGDEYRINTGIRGAVVFDHNKNPKNRNRVIGFDLSYLGWGFSIWDLGDSVGGHWMGIFQAYPNYYMFYEAGWNEDPIPGNHNFVANTLQRINPGKGVAELRVRGTNYNMWTDYSFTYVYPVSGNTKTYNLLTREIRKNFIKNETIIIGKIL